MLNNKELLEIEGGAIKWGIATIIGAVISFVVGIIEGYFKPNHC